ncbi:hypothetical protein Sme01_55450 [Sphaerisporangium melleum]|uniref:CHAT domain-containing protein n=1 Tax=Sphaerisporangium melleum TaxID=321316 RepID=A0A917RR40_9ACTN|nr:CHAT domain-containing protein [Sphaerisporangium melleum]GGL20596.1 hypothetical protein GCM10007964_73160 [Sphaerisporangium melleum]GII73069.1 hypothetical protein Sme01_55450 [Sphaerisporangium melleum]
MDLSRIPALLGSLWDELPRLIGPGWTDLYPRVAAAARRLAEAGEAERPRAVFDLAQLFRPYPEVAERIRDAMEHRNPAVRRTRSPSRLPPTGRDEARADPWEAVTLGLLRRIDGPVLECRTAVYATRRLAAGARGVIVVGLTAAPGAEAELAAVHAGRHVEVHLPAGHDAGVTVTDETVRRLTVRADGTTDLAAFAIRAVTPGEHTLRADLRQDGRLLASVPVTVTVAPAGTEAVRGEGEPEPVGPATVRLGGGYAPPPDLDLRVLVEARDGRTVLRYILHSPNGAAGHHYEEAGEVVLAGSPDEQRDRLLRRIERLAPEDTDEKLRAFGERLYREVLSPEVRRAYARFRDTVRSLQVTSDEPWIPWELVRPFDDDGWPGVDDDFWAARFDLARWLAGSSAAPARIEVGRLACVEAGSAPGFASLPAVAEERKRLAALAGRHGIDDASPVFADRAAVHALLRDPSIGLWHFACHGEINAAHPDEAELMLADGHALQAEDLYGPRQAAVAEARPLVVLNACRVGGQGWSLTRLGGWADAWVRRCRCGGLIGAQWSVTDEVAAGFAQAFYRHLEEGRTLATAARAARAEVRAAFPGDPSWLAYSLYAHPNARIGFGPP